MLWEIAVVKQVVNDGVTYFVKDYVWDLACSYRLRRNPDGVCPFMSMCVVAIPAMWIVGSIGAAA